MRHGIDSWDQLAWAAGLAAATAAAPLVLLGLPAAVLVPGAVVLGWSAGRHLRSLGVAVSVLTGTALVTVLVPLVRDPRSLGSAGITTLLLQLLVAVLPWWLGRSRRLRLEQAARERALVEQQARAGERSRIARDMHDSLGHDLALIALQAGAWELTAGTPEQRAAAAAVRSAAVAATDRLHLVIGLLVGPDSPTGASTAQEEEPGAAGGTDVTALVERARRRGMAVELSWSRAEVAGAAAPWSAETARAAARVVQEGLTNAAKHAPGSQVVVRVEDADPVRVEVVSTGGSTPTASSGGGRGLIGLDERLRVLRGRLEAGRGDAGFHLVATMTRQARAAGPVDGDPAARQLVDLRRQGRRGRLRAALLPVSLALALATTLATAHAVTVAQTALAPADYERLRLGQPRVEVAALLPPRSQAQPPPLLVVPPAPAGASCSYYQARSSVLDLSSDMFRLCFGQLPGTADEPVLIAKDHLVAAVGGR